MARFQFVRRRLVAPPQGIAALCSLVAAVIAPTLLRQAIDPWVTGATFVAYFPFVLLAALFLGSRSAMLATIGSAVAANFLFMEPRYIFFAGMKDTAGALLFVVSSLLMIAVAETLRGTLKEVEAAQAHELHLNRELQHRVKNTMAVIQGLATQTFREPASEPDLRKFQGRLTALARAHDILSHGHWETCSLPDLAVRALDPFNMGGAISLYGPPCSLREESCVPLVLALHELATNAVKYGSLSTQSGNVDVVWSFMEADAADERNLLLEWMERGGPEVQQPTRRGLGSRLLRPQRGVRDVQLSFPAAGATCRIHLPGAEDLPEGADKAFSAPPTIYSTEVPPTRSNG